MSTDYERAYFERGFIGAAAWEMTKKRGVKLSDAVIDHAWDHRDEGMGPTECLPKRPTAAPAEREEVARVLPDTMPGHWDTAEGREIAVEYAGRTRESLMHGDKSDLVVANGVFLADRYDLDLIVWQTAAKERIRWLSAQLAILAKLQPSDRADQGEAASKGGWVRVPVEPTEAIINAMEAVDHPNNHAAFYCDLYAAMLAAAASAEDKS